MSRRALITGVCGMDGWYLSRFLLEKGYEVVGTRRGNEEASESPPGVKVVFGDVSDAHNIREVVEQSRPDEIYNLAAITHVGDSFSAMATSFQVNAVGCANTLDAAARVGAKYYQASTSELFGDSPPPQSEETALRPRSPYAVAKLAAYWLTKNYRERGYFAASSWLFNHESPLRPIGFVTRKVTHAVAEIATGKRDKVVLGNLDAERDWGFAGDYVRAIWLSMQEETPDEYVVATGVSHSVKHLAEVAFKCAGLNWEDHVESSDEFKRPLEVEFLRGDPTKARTKLGWEPRVDFETLIERMVWADLKRVSGQRLTLDDLMLVGLG